MEQYAVSARKYRPDQFSDVVGQSHITHTLQNAIKTQHLAHAFLFCGPRGVGKTTCARILARTINCTNLSPTIEACNECESCKSFNENASFNIFELDAASNNSVENIRMLIDQVRIPPQGSKYKVYIIDEVHMLSSGAFNAFLKTLEEPPNYAIFILATTEKHKILPTILSRCQIFDFNRVNSELITKHLVEIAKKEQVAYEPDALHIIAQKADGGMRDALSMFDRIVSFTNGKLTYGNTIDNLNVLDYDYYFQITDQILTQDVANILLTFNQILDKGFEGDTMLMGLSEHLRNLLVCKEPSTLKLLDTTETLKAKYIQQSELVTYSFVTSILDLLNKTDVEYKFSKNKKLHVEMALIRACFIQQVLETNTAPSKAVKSIPFRAEYGTTSVKTLTLEEDNGTTPIANQQKKEEATTTSAPKDIIKSEKIVEKKISASAFNLKQLNTLIKEQNKVDSKVDFTIENVKKYWLEIGESYKESRPFLYNLTVQNLVKIKDEVIVFKVTTKQHELELRKNGLDIMQTFRKIFNNKNLMMNIKVEIQENTENGLFTTEERFKYLAEKNPLLLQLKNKLSLDL